MCSETSTMGKLIIMSSNPQVTPSTEAPFAPSDIHNLSTVIHIVGGLEKAVNVLESTTKSHTEKIEQLTQWVSAIPYLEKSVAQNTNDLSEIGTRHTKDLNELGRRLEKDVNELGKRHDRDIKELEKVAHTANTLGKIAFSIATPVAATLITAVLVYIYHVVEKLLLLK
jgi:DNA repair ATPase RecN